MIFGLIKGFKINKNPKDLLTNFCTMKKNKHLSSIGLRMDSTTGIAEEYKIWTPKLSLKQKIKRFFSNIINHFSNDY